MHERLTPSLWEGRVSRSESTYSGRVPLDWFHPEEKRTPVLIKKMATLRAVRPPQPNAALRGQHRLNLPEGGCCCAADVITGDQYDS